MCIRFLLACGFLCLSLGVNANTYTTIALPELNTNIKTWSDGGQYNAYFPSASTLGGVPFNLQQNSAGNNSFVGTLSIPVDIYGVTSIYTLMNTAWGQFGAEVGSLTAIGSAGAMQTFTLIEGDNIRDHFYGNYVNSLSATYVTPSVIGGRQAGSAHIDMQAFTLNAAFSHQILTTVVFNGAGGNPQGMPFIAGLSVSAVPEPASIMLWLAGLTCLGLYARRITH
ncbi:MAG: hypothetical protein U1F46_10150 [Marinagarivorans sp.]